MSDVDGPSLELWGDLRRHPVDAFGQFAAHELRVDGERCGLFMAVGHDLGLHLFLPVEADEASGLPVRLNGLEVHERRVVLGSSTGLYVDLASTPAYEAMFTVVAREVARSVAVQGVEGRKAAVRTIRRWQTFWRTPRGGALTKSEQIGLFGEVWWLHRVLIPALGPSAVYRWTGPHGERHDFQGSAVHLEAKVTERELPVFRISGLDQLDPPDGKQLALATLMVREETGADVGLVTEVLACELALGEHVAELEAFRERLAAAGYRRESEPEWDRLRLRLRGADLYLVDEAFPRLTTEWLEGGCPPGVSHVSYDLDLSMVTPTDEAMREAIVRGLVAP